MTVPNCVAKLAGVGEFGDEVGKAARETAVAGLQTIVVGPNDVGAQILRGSGGPIVGQVKPVEGTTQARDRSVDHVHVGNKPVLFAGISGSGDQWAFQSCGQGYATEGGRARG